MIKCHVFDVIHEMGIVKDVLVVFGISRNLKLVLNVIKEEVWKIKVVAAALITNAQSYEIISMYVNF